MSFFHDMINVSKDRELYLEHKIRYISSDALRKVSYDIDDEILVCSFPEDVNKLRYYSDLILSELKRRSDLGDDS